eukprot:gene3159-3612_t
MTLAVGTLGACKKYLDVNPQDRILTSNYYKTQTEVFSGLVSIYDSFGYQYSGLYDKVAIMDVASDDHWAGGGGPGDINDLQVMETYKLNSQSGPSTYLWSKGYQGIFRANFFLSKVTDAPIDAGLKSRFAAEAKTLRAIFYFDLVRFFKNIPLLLQEVDPAKVNDVVQALPAEVYAQMEKDLSEAIPSLPATVPAATEGGRITKGAAQALLGKVYLWQKKFDKAAEQFALVNGPTPGQVNPANGYKLLNNYADLWNVNNKFNSESILEIVKTTSSNGGWSNAGASDGNLLNIITGPRGYQPIKPDAPDYYPGYGFLLFTKEFFAVIHYDPRNAPTVANLDSLRKNGIANYSDSYNNTGYMLEKFIGRQKNKPATGQTELNFGQDIYEIRLADTYLLEVDALLNGGAAVGAGSRAYQLLNAVRARVGLNPVAVTMDNLVLERRLELAGEGHRWLDLVRWGRTSVLAYKGFDPAKNTVFPIPQKELNNTKIEQNKEWGGTK